MGLGICAGGDQPGEGYSGGLRGHSPIIYTVQGDG
jgi:hypothetical protein